jgi:hypothetical protein
MAVDFTSGTSDCRYTGSTIDGPSAFSAYWWYRQSAYDTLNVMFDLDTHGVLYFSSSGSFINYVRNFSTTNSLWFMNTTDMGFTPSATNWQFMAITHDGTTGVPTWYHSQHTDTGPISRNVGVNTAPVGTADTPTNTELYIGNNDAFLYRQYGDMAFFGCHSVELSAEEIAEAMWHGMTLRSPIFIDPLWDHLTTYDLSGNGHSLSSNGTPGTTDYGPPVIPLWHRNSAPLILPSASAASVEAYGDTITNLSPDHHWTFSNDLVDGPGTNDGTGTGTSFVTSPLIAEDTTHSVLCNARGDRISASNVATMNSAALDRRVMGGWFMVTAIQDPPTNIYKEGTTTNYMAMLLTFGNFPMLAVADASDFEQQVYADRALQPNRAYHVCYRFSGSGFDNAIDFFLDGVLQTDAEPADREPDATDHDAHTGAPEWGDMTSDLTYGGGAVLVVGQLNAQWNHWASWSGAGAALTDTQIREELFEKGAVPDQTISSGTESAMQTSLDALADTVRPDEPLCIRVEDVTGGGDFTLVADNITFNSLASIHVQFYSASGTLTWVNTNGANATIGSDPWAGTLVIQNRVDVTVTVRDASNTATLIQNARVRLLADTGGPLTAGTVILEGLTNASGQLTGTVDLSADQPVTGRVRKSTSGSALYKTASLVGSIDSSLGYDQTALMIPDE